MKRKTLNLSEKSHSQLKFMASSCNQKLVNFLETLLNETFYVFKEFNPREKSSKIFFDSWGRKLIITTSGRSYLKSGIIQNVPLNISDSETDKLVFEKISQSEENET